MALGGRSLEITICLPLSCSALKVWKNSSWVCSRPSSIWMSSISRMSVLRYWSLNDLMPPSRSALMNSLVKVSTDTYRTERPGWFSAV